MDGCYGNVKGSAFLEDVACILEEKVYHRDILLLTGGFLWTLFWIN